MKNSEPTSKKQLTRVSSAVLLLGAVALTPSIAQHGRDVPVNITSVDTRRTPQGAVITLSADAPLNRTQTWQDANGEFHMVLPRAGQSRVRSGHGVRVQRIGDSLEIIVPSGRGANVTVQPRFNRMDLIVNGDVSGLSNQSGNENPAAQNARVTQRGEPLAAMPSPRRLPRARRYSSSGAPQIASAAASQMSKPKEANYTPQAYEPSPAPVSSTVQRAGNGGALPATTTTAPQQNSSVPAVNSAATINNPSTAQAAIAPAVNAPVAPPVVPIAPAASAAAPESGEEGGIFSFLFSTVGIILLVVLGLVALLVLRRRKASGFEDVEGVELTNAVATTKVEATADPEAGGRRRKERRKKGRRESDEAANLPALSTALAAGAAQREAMTESQGRGLEAHAPAVLFGAYRVDQEVGKLVLGQPHRMDVLASRALDDRRAIEASLIKALTAADTDESGRRRASEALEEYGFVARQSAALLLAPDAYERASAAQTLGEIRSSTSLQFLLEALYDSEAIVRTRAVESLGALKLPSAIGALLDMARRHPEMPAALLSRALNECSLDALDIFGTQAPERAFLSMSAGESFTGEITNLESAGIVEQLPEWLEDETLAEAFAGIESANIEVRTAAARALAQFQVQRSVIALTKLAAHDGEPVVRAAAVTSLGAIDHESVFAPVLTAFGDEAREVRAAAARALSRLNFDRADAYVRVAETADAETMREVARACIKAGMAGQAIDRLASEDRRPAYEAFSLLSLLVKSDETQPILDAIEHHGDMNVRLAAVRLLGLAGSAEVASRLRQLAVRDGVPEKVRAAVLEVVYKMDQTQTV
ncbi:MAG: HEAT repeat domain-containing protein [Pyrinomonadaceae bacterium]